MTDQKDNRLKQLKKLALRVSRYPEATMDIKRQALDDIGRLAIREGMKETEFQVLKTYMNTVLKG